MTKKNTTWVIVIVVVLVVLGLILLTAPKTPEANPEENQETGEQVTAEQNPAETEALIPGTSPVSKGGKVLTAEGKPADNTALPGSPEAPKQSGALTQEEIPEEAVKISVSSSGFSPNEFTARPGSAVTISITSEDMTHVFKFDDPALQAVAIGMGGKQTRAITFNAPEAGDYTFYCDVPGHRDRGEIGVMHVK